jgi:excisionase family DNA binding protein
MADQEDRFEGIEEVAERLLVDPQTVRRWIKSGKLKAYKPGREYRILSSDLDAFLDDHSSPKALAPSPEPEQGRRSSVLTEAIVATVDKWIEIASAPDTSEHKSIGISRAASALGDSIEDVVNADEALWGSLPGGEQHEIMRVMEKITEVIQVATQRLGDEILKKEFNQRREEIREWTRQISA